MAAFRPRCRAVAAPARCCAPPKCRPPKCSSRKIVFWLVWIGFIVSAIDTLQFAPFRDSCRSFSGSCPRFWSRCWCSRSAAGRKLSVARDAARVRERQRARGAAAERRSSPACHRDRRGDGTGTTGFGDDRRVDRLRDHVWRAHAGTGDRVRTRRTRCREGAARRDSFAPKPRTAIPTPRRTSVVAHSASETCMPRSSSGILLHPTSLPGRYRHWRSGPAAFEFVDLLASAGTAALAGAAARSDRLWRLAVSVFLRVCRQPAADQPRTTDRRWTAHRGRCRRRRQRYRGHCRLPRGDRAPRALWPRVLDRFDATAPPECAIASSASVCRRRAGWTTSRCSWRSRMRTAGGVDTWDADIAAREPAAIAALVGALCARNPACTS